ncbi:MAG TPA: hypothetical protein VD966_06240 [Pyrinomonadaceae bacterium]|nr:hypothetical protein [Pyrinomonadaceae bacterium]
MRFQMKCIPAAALALVLVIFAPGCGGADETEKANELVDESNKAAEAANKSLQEGLTIHQQIFSEANIFGFPGNRDALKGHAQREVELLSQSALSFREAANKYEEASRLRLNEQFKQYLSLKAQETRKQAEQSESIKEMAQVVLDDSITDLNAYVLKLDDIRIRVQKAGKEQKELKDQAEKIRAENQGKIKS